MATYVHQYVSRLVDAQAAAARMLGVDIYGISRDVWVMNLTQLTLIGVVMQRITAVAPAVTDQVWIDALSHALDSSQALPWPQDMLDQVKPGTVPPVV